MPYLFPFCFLTHTFLNAPSRYAAKRYQRLSATTHQRRTNICHPLLQASDSNLAISPSPRRWPSFGEPPKRCCTVKLSKNKQNAKQHVSILWGFLHKKGLFRAILLYPKNTPTPKIVKNEVKTLKKQAKSPKKRTLKNFYFFSHTLDKKAEILQSEGLFPSLHSTHQRADICACSPKTASFTIV
jgi:hypothetical protein